MVYKIVLFSILFFTIKSFSDDTNEYTLEFCLSSLHTAEKAHQKEFDTYTSDPKRLNLAEDLCPMVAEYEFTYVEKNFYEALAIGHRGEVLGQINSLREVVIY